MAGATQRQSRLAGALAVAVVGASSLALPSSSNGHILDVGFDKGPPSQVFEGQKLTLSVFVHPSSPRCTLTIRYKGGRTDRRSRAARKGRAAWTFRVPPVRPGVANLTVSCKGAGKVRAQMLIQWALQAPKLIVGKRGFSQRPNVVGGSDVSYGLELRNERTRFDAIDVAVLVNFVDSTNRVLGSAHASVGRVPRATTFYVGGQQPIPETTPVSRLEIVIGPARSAQIQPSLPPFVSDVVIVPDSANQYVDSVRGQLLNRYRLPMQSADLGIVLVDSAGNIVGGGRVSAAGPLSLGAREFFSTLSGFSAVPLSRAVKALVSPVPTYQTSP